MAWKGQVAAKTAGDVDQAKAAVDFGKSTALEDYIPSNRSMIAFSRSSTR